MVRTFGKKLAVLAALVMGSVGTAQAVPHYWSDYVVDLTRVSAGNSYSYQHNITDGAFGYRPGVDSIAYATLGITLGDDAIGGDLPSWLLGDSEEKAGFRFDNGAWQIVKDPTVEFISTFDFVVTSLLNLDGLLNVTISANRGDFLFGISHLQAYGDRAAAVPEPGTLALFGVSLLGLGLATRRRRLAK